MVSVERALQVCIGLISLGRNMFKTFIHRLLTFIECFLVHGHSSRRTRRMLTPESRLAKPRSH